MRTVFTNDMCAHVWAQLKQPHGRSDSMSFDGAVAYSYRAPIAHLVVPFGKSAPVALFTDRSYSVTTAKHMSLYRRAASHLPSFNVPEIFEGYKARSVRDEQSTAATHHDNLVAFRSAYVKERDALMRCPADSWRLGNTDNLADNPFDRINADTETRAHVTLRELASNMLEYCKAFGIPCDVLPWQADADKAKARRDRIMSDPKRAAKMEAARVAREAREAREFAEREAARIVRRIVRLRECAETVAKWRAGEDVHLPWDATRDADGSAMLRIRGDMVQTSQGAEAPLAHVRQVLRFWSAAVASGAEWSRDDRAEVTATEFERNRMAYTLGHFKLDRINADGSIRAGCHFITRREIESLAATIGAPQS